MSALLGINYDETEPFTYRYVYVMMHGGNKAFASGDVIKDFKDALTFCADRNYAVHYSSTVTNFLTDTDMYDLTEDGLLEAREVKLLPMAPIEELTKDLTTPQYIDKGDNVIVLESKDSIRTRLGRSTDFGDAVCLAFWGQTGGGGIVI